MYGILEKKGGIQMGFFMKILGAGVAFAAVKKIVDTVHEEDRRTAVACRFDGDVSREEFYAMVSRAGRNIRRVTNLYADGAIVYGTVRAQSGISEWHFRIDFNDYGNLTGNYRVFSDNSDSEIPRAIATRIAQQIEEYPDCVDEEFEYNVKVEEWKERKREERGAKCPFCGEQNQNEDAKFCSYCGRRFC